MNSPFFKLKLNDLAKGLVVAVLATVFTSLGTALSGPGFDFASFDWGEILKVAFAAASGYLGKNLLSNESGKVFGKIG